MSGRVLRHYELPDSEFVLILSDHFVDDRMVDQHITERDIQQVLESTISRDDQQSVLTDLDDLIAGHASRSKTPFTAILRSQSKQISVVVGAQIRGKVTKCPGQPAKDKILLVVVTVRKSLGFISSKPGQDYEISINPRLMIRFRRGMSRDLRNEVLVELADVVDQIQDCTAYHIGGATVDFWVARAGDVLQVDQADWKFDTAVMEVN